MPTRKYRVTHEDGRTTDVLASDEAGAKRQANHQETTRVLIAAKRGGIGRTPMSMAVAAVCLEREPGVGLS